MSNPVAVNSLYGKRKRKKVLNPNPLFSKWITEWMEEARQKGWKSEFIYSKALRSLRKFPLPLSTGKECKILQNFGDKICKMLDDRLLKYKQEQENQVSSGLSGMGHPSSLPTSCAVPAPSSLSHAAPTVPSSSCARPSIPHVRPLAVVHEISDSSDDEGTNYNSLTRLKPIPLTSSNKAGIRPAADRHCTALKARGETAITKTTVENAMPGRTDSGHIQGTTKLSPVCGVDNKYLSNEDDEQEVTVVGHTSPTRTDSLEISDEDELSPVCGVDNKYLSNEDDEQEVTVVGHTSPTRTDSLEISDEDDLPMLPDLSDLDMNALPRQPDSRTDDSVSNRKKIGPEAVAAVIREMHSISDSDEDKVGQAARPQQTRGRTGGQQPKQYVPAYRSGPYAILLTLFRHAQEPNFRGFMTKAELSRAAQPLADKSFTVADPGSCYTAWSSVSTLIRKGLLTKESSPAKYRLTDEGYEVVHRLEQAEAGTENHPRDEGEREEGRREGHPHSGNDAVDNGRLLTDGGTRDSCSPQAGTASGQASRGYVFDTDQHSTHALHLSNSPVRQKHDSQTSMSKDKDTGSSEDFTLRAVGEEAQHLGVDDGDDDDGLLVPSLPSLAQRLKASSAVDQPAAALTVEKKVLQYWYVSEGDRPVIQKDQACVSLDEDFGIGFLVKINYQHLLQSGSEYRLDMTRPLGDDYVFAYLADAHCCEEAPPPVSSSQACSEATSSRRIYDISDTESEPESVTASTTAVSSSIHNRPPPQRQASSSSSTKPGSYAHAAKGIATDPCSSNSSAVHLSSSAAPRGTKSKGISDPISAGSKSSCPSVLPRNPSGSKSHNTQSSNVTSEAVEDFILYPGTFEIVLCVDNREFYGSNSSSKSLLPGLVSKGVNCDLRLLNVGDLLWVAREKAAPGAPLAMMGDGAQPARRELVLNYVVERKRMDDFVGSMITGRMKEQKFRLKHSGLKEKIILLESYGSMQHFSISEDRIKQAIANTVIIDGFTVKQTHDAKETAAYLTVMTRYLQGYYQNKTLQSCSQDSLKELGIKCAVSDTEQMLMPFDHFNQASLKSKPLTVLELFAKQLIQLHGMSADKAKAVVDRYPTPSSLFEAYSQCQTEKERDSLLASLKYGKNLRNLGIAISRQIRQLYTTHALT